MGKVGEMVGVQKVLGELWKDKELSHVRVLKCIKTFERDGKEIFTQGKDYKVNVQYSGSFLVKTEEGFGHEVTNGGEFMKEYFEELK